MASGLNQDNQKLLYSNLHSGAESGWDFSTRWFVTSTGTNDGSLADIATKQIIPVDLNAYLCMNSRLLSELYSALGDDSKASYYQAKFALWKEAMRNVTCLKDSNDHHSKGILKFRFFGTKPKAFGLILTHQVIGIEIISMVRMLVRFGLSAGTP